MKRVVRTCAVLLLLFGAMTPAPAEFRFPMPEFESDYQQPQTHAPLPEEGQAVLDVAVLAAALGLSAWLVLKRRSRNEVFLLMVFSLLYFGFWRKGCVCSVGSLQNVVAAAFDQGVTVSVAVLAFFLLPLVFALFFGRVFCAAVCPLGAIQDAVVSRPVHVPRPVEAVLGVFPYVYLGLAVLSVANGAGFLICRYDPFVGIFRQGASFNMFLVGGLLLLIGVFVGRPYCRFLCPYGVLLRWMSRFSKWHAVIPQGQCIQCRLCEESCPFDAIHAPTPEDRPLGRRQGARHLGVLIVLLPVAVALGGGTGLAVHEVLARLHPTVRLAERIVGEERGRYTDQTLASEAFRASEKGPAELYAEARDVQRGFKHGSTLLGGFLGIVVIGKLIGLSVVRTRTDYEPDRAACLSCGRCFAYCPVEGENASA